MIYKCVCVCVCVRVRVRVRMRMRAYVSVCAYVGVHMCVRGALTY